MEEFAQCRPYFRSHTEQRSRLEERDRCLSIMLGDCHESWSDQSSKITANPTLHPRLQALWNECRIGDSASGFVYKVWDHLEEKERHKMAEFVPEKYRAQVREAESWCDLPFSDQSEFNKTDLRFNQSIYDTVSLRSVDENQSIFAHNPVVDLVSDEE